MTFDQMAIFAILAVTLVLFVWGRWRYDIVAFATLIATVAFGLIPVPEAFGGFSHPATITVALVLVLSRALSNSGAIDLLAKYLSPTTEAPPSLHIAYFGGIGGALSAVMNNVGALALLMPMAVQSAVRAKFSPATLLMPLSFATILGGLITLIGTPPNIIVALYRGDAVGAPFAMFDFTPVGATVALVGVAFVTLVGWRLIPAQRRARISAEELFDIENYVTEARVPEGSQAVGQSIRELEALTGELDAVVVGLIRNERRILGAMRQELVEVGDILVIEAGPGDIDKFLSTSGLDLVGTEEAPEDLLRSEDVALVEAVVPPRARIENRTVADLRLRARFGVNLLAVSRQGRPLRDRLRAVRIARGDVLLLQGIAERLPEVIVELGCLPLAERGLQVGKRPQAGLAVVIFATAIVSATVGLASIQVAFAAAAIAMVLLNIIAPREIYDSVDWPVIILVGALIPVGSALETTGATQVIAAAMLSFTTGQAPMLALAVLMIVTMLITNILNNAASALVMAPIGFGLAQELMVSPDPFLMAVAVGASSAFLTPIGHQNNTLILGPGGYHFGDYWRMGLPLQVIILAIAIPMILWVWPL